MWLLWSRLFPRLVTSKHQKHCVKSVRIWSYPGPHFPAFGLNTERYGVLWCFRNFKYETLSNVFVETFIKNRFRSTRLQIFFNISVLINFCNIQSKKPAGLKDCNFIKKWLYHMCFPMTKAKALKFFYRKPLVAASVGSITELWQKSFNLCTKKLNLAINNVAKENAFLITFTKEILTGNLHFFVQCSWSFRRISIELWTYFTPFFSVCIADFEQVFVCREKYL